MILKERVLLPHKMSALGPGLAVGDVDGNGQDDFFIGGSVGQSGSIFLQSKTGKFTLAGTQAYSEKPSYERHGSCFF